MNKDTFILNSKLISKIFCMKTKAKRIIKYSEPRMHDKNLNYITSGTRYLGGWEII